MKNITINQAINALSVLLQYLLIVFAGFLFSKSIWWIVNPLGYNTYDNIVNRNFDSAKLAQTIVNRAPFGTITATSATIEIAPPPPGIAEQIKVVGVYAAGPKNSVAFLTVDNKSLIATLGESVLTATIKAIKPNGVVFFYKNQEVEINLAESATHNSQKANNSPSSFNSNISQSQAPDTRNDSSYLPSIHNNDDASSNANDNNDDPTERRRKMIEAFQKQNIGDNDTIKTTTNNNGNNANNSDQQNNEPK